MHAYSTHAQPGCPEIFAGNDTVVPCTNSCIDLVAQPFRVGETTSYTVESIPYNPPFPYTAGTPLFIGIDDIWSPVQPLPFAFCYFGNAYNQVVVGTNGVLTFDVTQAMPCFPTPFSERITTLTLLFAVKLPYKFQETRPAEPLFLISRTFAISTATTCKQPSKLCCMKQPTSLRFTFKTSQHVQTGTAGMR